MRILLLICLLSLPSLAAEPCKFAKVSNAELRGQAVRLASQLRRTSATYQEKVKKATDRKAATLDSDVQAKPLFDEANCLKEIMATRMDKYYPTAPTFKTLDANVEELVNELEFLAHHIPQTRPSVLEDEAKHREHK